MPELPLSVEERLAALEAVVNKLKGPPMDLLLQEGYFQLGSSDTAGAQRFDRFGHQIAMGNDGTGVAVIYMVPTMEANPLLNGPQGQFLAGYNAGAGSMFSKVIARQNPTQIGNGSNAFLQVNGNSSNAIAQLVADFEDDGAGTYFKVIDDNSDPRIVWSLDGGFNEYRLESGGGMTIKVKEADESVTSSTTLQNDDELWFAVAANEVWQFEGSMFIDTISSADFRFAVTGPSGAVGRVFAAYSDTAAFDAHVGAGDLGDTIDLQTFNTGTLVRFWGGIHNGANAGNLQVQWAQRVSQGTATTVHAGSYIKYQQANV